MKSVYLALIIAIIIVDSVFKVDTYCGIATNEGAIVTVLRRKHMDLYHPADSPHMTCEEQETFMIEERRCVKNENIFKAFSVTVLDYASPRPVLQLRNGRLELNTSQHYHDKESSLDCHIARLEVIRGLERAFEIDHSGFSFTSANSTLKINIETLAYSPTEYEGELYHIQLSCNEDSNDYIFVAWGMTNVTEPKFNCTVPGTLYTYTIDCPALQTTDDKYGPSKGSVATGTVVGIFAVLALGLLCTSTIVFIKKSKRVKVLAVRSRILEHKNSKMHKKCDLKNEKDTANEKCILYATPGELSQSNLYRLESNPAYREPAGVSHYELDEPLECDDSVIPRHLNPCYQYTEGPIYQEAISLQASTMVTRPRTDLNSEPKSEDVLYEPMEL